MIQLSTIFILVLSWFTFATNPFFQLLTTSIGSTTDTTITNVSAPLEASTTTPPRINRLVVVGDIMLARDVDHRSHRAQNPLHPFSRISFSRVPAYVLGNFEAAIPVNYRETPPFTFTFAAPSSSAAALVSAGFTHLSLANNHSLDYGYTGYLETATRLSESGLLVAGQSRAVASTSVMYLSLESQRLAIVNVSTIGYTPSSTQLAQILQEASVQSDFQLVYIHWGNEYALTHHLRQSQLAEQLVRWGADAIVGHHPHVVQDIAYINGVPVIYSLGNFVFDQYFSRDVAEGLVAVFDFQTETIRLYPVTSIDARVQPRYMTVDEADDFLSRVATRSDPTLTSQIQNGVLLLHGTVATSSKAVMIEE